MRGYLLVAGFVAGLLCLAATPFWPSSVLIVCGIVLIVGSFVAGNFLRPLPALEQKRLDETLLRNAQAARGAGYVRYAAGIFAWVLRRSALYLVACALVAGYVMAMSPLNVLFTWLALLAGVGLLAILAATWNYVFLTLRMKSILARMRPATGDTI